MLRLVACIVGLAAASVPAPIVIGPADATAAVIFLHGIGDSGKGISNIAPSLQKHLPYARFIFPTAGQVPITLAGGMLQRAWFDMSSMSPHEIGNNVDEKRIKRSAGRLLHIVEEQVAKGLPRNRIVVGGFSQGAVVSLFGAFYSDKFSGLAGCMAMSGYFPSNAGLLKETRRIAEQRKANEKIVGPPVLMVHGTEDQVLQFALGKQSYTELKSWSTGVSVAFHAVKGMGHTIDEKALSHMSTFLKKVLPIRDEL